jgi:predicted TIM-barrel enzyme
MWWFEEYILKNAEIFARAGIPAIKLQDETRESGHASPSTIARLASLGRLIKKEFPHIHLGIIVQAHDGVSPLAIADASGADFVRLKIFVGQMLTAEGPKDGLGVSATNYRYALGRTDIALLSDVYDRTSFPRDAVPLERAASWTASIGADGLVITGDSFPDTLERIRRVRAAGLKHPILVGGGVTAGNVAEVLRHADGAVVSRAIMRKDADKADIVRWDRGACENLMAVARNSRPAVAGTAI